MYNQLYLPPVVKNLLIINGIFFFATWILGNSGINLEAMLSAYYPASHSFRLWQIVTYMFIHANLQHVFFNMLGLFFMGPIIESTLGAKRFLNYYIICGLGAILIQYMVQLAEVKYYSGSFFIDFDTYPFTEENFSTYKHLAMIYFVPQFGASGAVFGLSAAMLMLYPEMEVRLYLMPIPVRIKYIIPLYMLVELWMALRFAQGDNIAHVARLGGAIAGFIVIKLWQVNKPNNFY